MDEADGISYSIPFDGGFTGDFSDGSFDIP